PSGIPGQSPAAGQFHAHTRATSVAAGRQRHRHRARHAGKRNPRARWLDQLPAWQRLPAAGSGAGRRRSAGCHPLGCAGTPGAGQPVRRTCGAQARRTRRTLADHRLLALAMPRPLDLGSDRTTAPMARLITPLLALLALVLALLSLSLGSTQVAVLTGLLDWLSGGNGPDAIVIGEIRLPRTLLALAVGAALGLSGAALQGLLRNPLADPGLTGASQGAALGAAGVFYFGLLPWAGAFAPALAGLCGAGIALTLMLGLAGSSGAGMVILAGLAISTLSGALLAAVLNFAPNPYAMQELVFWLLGSVSERGLEHLLLLGPALLIGFLLIWGQRRLLLGLSLGEQVAQSLGLAHKRGSRLVVLGCALLVGASVA